MSILLLLGVLYVEIFLEELTYLKFIENMDFSKEAKSDSHLPRFPIFKLSIIFQYFSSHSIVLSQGFSTVAVLAFWAGEGLSFVLEDVGQHLWPYLQDASSPPLSSVMATKSLCRLCKMSPRAKLFPSSSQRTTDVDSTDS